MNEIINAEEIKTSNGANELAPINVPEGKKEMLMQTKYVAAQFVPIPRNLEKINKDLLSLAKIAKDNWFYEFKIFNKKEQRYSFVRGGTIGLARTIVQMYGNCTILEEIKPYNTNGIILENTLVDFEKGFTITRCEIIKEDTPPGKWDHERWNRMVTNKHRSFNLRGLIQSYVPGFIWDGCIQAARNAALLEADIEIKSKEKLDEIFGYFKSHNVSEQKIRDFLDIGKNDPLTGKHYVLLKNIKYQIEHGETSVKEISDIVDDQKEKNRKNEVDEKNEYATKKLMLTKKLYEKMEMDGIKESTVLEAYGIRSIGMMEKNDIDLIIQDWDKFRNDMLNLQTKNKEKIK